MEEEPSGRDETNMNGASRVVITVLFLACLSVGTAATGGVAVETTGESDASPAVPRPGSLQEMPNESNDSTDHHVNPEELERDEDLSHVQSWLASEMSSRLEQSSEEIREGQYESARRLLGDEYEERFDQYREVAQQVRGERAETESVGRLREEQQEFLIAVQTYETTYDELEETRENGSVERARRVARQLQSHEVWVNEQNRSLIEAYRAVSNDTEMNLSESEEITRNTSENISERQREVEEELFVQTELTATAENETASFADPVTIRGQLRAENGSAIANENVTFFVGNRTLETRTNDTGAFQLEYAPTNLPSNTTEVTMQYLPDNESVYDWSFEMLPVEITTSDPTIDVAEGPDSVAFGEEVVVRGTVRADGEPVPGVPVALFVGDERLGNATTAWNGTFTLRGPLPADVPLNSTLRVSLPLENRTLTAANETANVSIRPTDTSLTMNASHTDDETVRVVGRLRTDDGIPVDNRSVEVRMNGRTLAVVQTGRTGVYDAVVTIPEVLRDGDEVTVGATFDGSGTNLNQTRTADTLSIATPTDRERFVNRAIDAVASAPWWMFLIVGSALVPITYGLAGRFGAKPEPIDAVTEPASGERSADLSGDAVEERGSELLSFAREQLDDGDPGRATHVVYVAVRRELGERFGLDRPLTHWEFFTSCRDAGLDEDGIEALRDVILAEERAQFAAGGVSAAVAERALEAAAALVGDDASGSDHAETD